ncbi:MAG TPA: hypothetical protein VF060_35340 [Trebonia sp.]
MPSSTAPPPLQQVSAAEYDRIFNRENRPNDITDTGPSLHDIGFFVRTHPDLVRMIATIVTEAERQGLYARQLTRLIDGINQLRLFGMLDQTLAKLFEDEQP